MVELAYTAALNPASVRIVGSSPTEGTMIEDLDPGIQFYIGRQGGDYIVVINENKEIDGIDDLMELPTCLHLIRQPCGSL